MECLMAKKVSKPAGADYFMVRLTQAGARKHLESLVEKLEAEMGLRVSMSSAAAIAIREADERRRKR